MSLDQLLGSSLVGPLAPPQRARIDRSSGLGPRNSPWYPPGAADLVFGVLDDVVELGGPEIARNWTSSVLGTWTPTRRLICPARSSDT
jgi:hypothetical protein